MARKRALKLRRTDAFPPPATGNVRYDTATARARRQCNRETWCEVRAIRRTRFPDQGARSLSRFPETPPLYRDRANRMFHVEHLEEAAGYRRSGETRCAGAILQIPDFVGRSHRGGALRSALTARSSTSRTPAMLLPRREPGLHSRSCRNTPLRVDHQRSECCGCNARYSAGRCKSGRTRIAQTLYHFT